MSSASRATIRDPCSQRDGRILAVMSVDGVNATTGDTAAPAQSGYVLSPDESADIAGWRKSMSHTAAFYFTALPDSYAARTGRPDNVGVIGVAVFRERQRVVPLGELKPGDASRAQAQSPAPAARAEGGAASNAAAESDARVLKDRLGTGYGRNESSYASTHSSARARPQARRSRSITTRTRTCSHKACWSRPRRSRAFAPIPFPTADARLIQAGSRSPRADRLASAWTASHTGRAMRASASPSDEELMLAYGTGDAAAFDALYARHKGGVYRYLLRQCRQPGVAAELFQDVWMNLIRARASYAPTAKFTTWLYRLAHNRMVDHFRASGHLTLVSADDEAHEDAVIALPAARATESRAGRITAGRAAARRSRRCRAAARGVLQQEGALSLSNRS
jgi:RNA polymerase sigma factor (sigma-70 family)